MIVKDLSRLGRNLIEIGYYIGKYFPRHSIHVISVTDQVDTADGMSNLDKRNSINIPLLNLCNDAVSDETSRNTQAVLNYFCQR